MVEKKKTNFVSGCSDPENAMEVNVVPFRREPGCVHTPPHPLETRLDFITLYIPVISAAPARCCRGNAEPSGTEPARFI